MTRKGGALDFIETVSDAYNDDGDLVARLRFLTIV